MQLYRCNAKYHKACFLGSRGTTFEKKFFCVSAILFLIWPPPRFKACVWTKSTLLSPFVFKLCAVIDITSVCSQARFREFVHTLGRVVAKRTHQRVCAVATRRNPQNGLKKFVYYRKRRRTYFLIETVRKAVYFILYIQLTVIHVRFRLFSRDFRALLSIFKLVFC